ncbi:hypothetical protein FIBSPDRAFT_863129, partial [Athelia psychrophila]
MPPCGTVNLLTFHVLSEELNELDRVESRTTVQGGCAAVQAFTRTIGRNPTPM